MQAFLDYVGSTFVRLLWHACTFVMYCWLAVSAVPEPSGGRQNTDWAPDHPQTWLFRSRNSKRFPVGWWCCQIRRHQGHVYLVKYADFQATNWTFQKQKFYKVHRWLVMLPNWVLLRACLVGEICRVEFGSAKQELFPASACHICFVCLWSL